LPNFYLPLMTPLFLVAILAYIRVFTCLGYKLYCRISTYT
jgi:hypothetical protein